jgi:hypothetical protein
MQPHAPAHESPPALAQSGEPASLAAWRGLCDASRDAFEEVYRVLDVRLEERGESFYNAMLPTVVEVGCDAHGGGGGGGYAVRVRQVHTTAYDCKKDGRDGCKDGWMERQIAGI